MAIPPEIPALTSVELQDLRTAKRLLEKPGLPARLANVIGGPIERGFQLLPRDWVAIVHKATRAALFKALEAAVATLGEPRKSGSERLHRWLVGVSGGVGGALGLPALPLELPISTALMLRSIADIARDEGHDLNTISTKLSCLEVFALGGSTSADDAAESAYWAVRAALAKAVSDAAAFLAERGVLEKSAPALVRLVGLIASRFGVIVSEQIAAKAVPLVGAGTGALINVLFMEHFQAMARGHFIVRRLEQKYGAPMVRQAYDQMALAI